MQETQQDVPSTITPELVTEMANAGVIIGHKKSKTHPRMKRYIAGNRNEIELLSPEAVLESLADGASFLRTILEKSGLILLVGSGRAAHQAVQEFATAFQFPFVTVRWLGGTLTNFKVISARLKYFEDLKAKRERGELQKYTKRERVEFDKEIGHMEKMFSGLHHLAKIPDALFVVDPDEHATAIREAKRLRIPVVALMDTDDDPIGVEYPILGSDHTRSSIEWIIGKIREELKKVVVKVPASPQLVK